LRGIGILQQHSGLTIVRQGAMSLLIRELGIMRRHDFDMLILFVTARCNSRCRHCFYWRNLDAAHEGLAIADMERIASSMPRFRTLLISGGEPSLRSDLPQIVDAFRQANGIQTVSVPTNGLEPDRISDLAEIIASLDDRLLVTFNVSVDGPSAVNDAIRGVPGSFRRAMETLSRLRSVAGRHANLRIYVNTVICAENLQYLPALARDLRLAESFDGHFFELARGDSPEPGLKSVPPAALKELYQALLPIQEAYLVREESQRRGRLVGALRGIAATGNLIVRYRHQLAVQSSGRKWDFPCVAGRSIGVVDYDGQLRVCELRSTGLPLASYSFDFADTWRSSEIRGEAEMAQSHVCDCTHTCFLGSSQRADPRARLLTAPWLFARYKLGLAL
jgi:MoaA/NifB/PqqE/SkfB family radical SAM enzyme